MTYKKINMTTWNRREHYAEFSAMSCSFSITVDIEVSNVLQVLKKQGYKFYPSMIYLLTNAVNQVPAFKMGMKEGELIEWNRIHPSYTIFHPESETFSSLWTEYHADISQFMMNYNLDYQRYQRDLAFSPKPNMPRNIFHISCLPWMSFTGFNLNVPKVEDYFSPIITFGKYRIDSDKTYLPAAIQVHHAVCDGFHVAKFVEALQQLCDEFS